MGTKSEWPCGDDAMTREEIDAEIIKELDGVGAPVHPECIDMLRKSFRAFPTRRRPEDFAAQADHKAREPEGATMVVARNGETTQLVFLCTPAVFCRNLSHFMRDGKRAAAARFLEQFAGFIEERGVPADRAVLSQVRDWLAGDA